MNPMLIYSSKTGFTEKYAHSLAEQLSIQAHKLEDIKDFEKFTQGKDTLIYGGGLYASSIDGFKSLQNRLPLEALRHLLVFTTGLSLPSDAVKQDVYGKNLVGLEGPSISFYYLRGGFHYQRLGKLDKFLMRLLKMRIDHKKKRGTPLNEDEKGMLAVFYREVDFTNMNDLQPLLQDIYALKRSHK